MFDQEFTNIYKIMEIVLCSKISAEIYVSDLHKKVNDAISERDEQIEELLAEVNLMKSMLNYYEYMAEKRAMEDVR